LDLTAKSYRHFALFNHSRINFVAAWFSRVRAPKPSGEDRDKLQMPGGLWTKCNGCHEIIYQKELERSLMVCPKCNYHFKMSALERIDLLADRHSFEELDKNLRSNDPLNFKDTIRYRERLKRAEKKTGAVEAVITGRALMDGEPVMLGVFNFAFLGGSMGAVVGEKLVRLIEVGCSERLPVIIVSASGGARMHEGIFSLFQMAKVTAGLVRLSDLGLPYISLLTDPTTGGVAASFSMLGDLNIAEPGALIGFAGPRVIEQTIHEKLPAGFQRSEFLLEHGMVDMIVPRPELKETLVKVIRLLTRKR
jgi:acetyl-CoA carboxylase carboxyl transferase subunit beta